MRQNVREKEKLQLWQKVRKSLEENKQLDLFHKGFLKPTQICLQYRQKSSMPNGLQQIIKKNISLNKYQKSEFKPFDSIGPNYDYQDLRQNHCDNLLSLMKRKGGQKIELAICICMYSEESIMLQRTLSGVRQNIATFIQNGVPADSIAVVLILDGIEVVDESMLSFFDQIQNDNLMYISKQQESVNARDLLENQLDQIEIKNMNDFLFGKEEAMERKNRQFKSRLNEYVQIKNLQKRTEELQRQKNLNFDLLQPKMQDIFYETAKKTKWQAYLDQENEQNEQTFSKPTLLKEYRSSKPVLDQTLIQTRKFCDEYLISRHSFALLHFFRQDLPMEEYRNNEERQVNPQQSLQMINSSRYQEHLTFKMNLFVITKYRNSGKLSSHNWFFNGICEELKPKYTVLLDVGLTPEKKALYRMYKLMVDKEKVGGVCGYMGVRIERLEEGEEINRESLDCLTSLTQNFFDIQRAQQIEYHLAHLVDKPFQATFNFIHVLPGAFSAYRMEALRPKEGQEESELLKHYFKSLDDEVNNDEIKIEKISGCQAFLKVLFPDILYNCIFKHREAGKRTDWELLEESNVHLAEDRTLCLGIYKNGYDLKYIPNAYAWVDPMKTLHGLFGQRKRWINGSYFAFQMVKRELTTVQGACCLYPQLLVMELMNAMAFISPALFLFTISMAMTTIQQQLITFIINALFENGDEYVRGQASIAFTYAINFIYSLIIFGMVVYSIHLNTRNHRFLTYIYFASAILGIFSFIVFVILLLDIIKGLGNIDNYASVFDNYQLVEVSVIDSLRYVIIASMATYVIPLVVYAIFYKRFRFIADVVVGFFSFIFYAPTYLNILTIYALSRIDDFSWGTKGLIDADEKNREMKKSWKTIKMIFVAKFVFWNVVVGAVLLSLTGDYAQKFYTTYAVLGFIALFLVIKIFIGTVYLIRSSCRKYGVCGVRVTSDLLQTQFEATKNSMYKDIQNNVFEISDDDYMKYRNFKVGKSLVIQKNKFKKKR